MRYRAIRLVNVGLHEDLEVEFADGMTGIVGDNGSGKTTILDAMEFGLTGSFPSAGNKDRNIRNTSRPGDPSYVKVDATHDGLELEISRYLRHGATTLKVDGKLVAVKESQVNAELATILGQPLSQMAEHSFVGQKTFFGFLEETPLKRAMYFQKLIGTSKCAKIYAALTAELSGLPEPKSTELLDQCRADISQAVAEVDRLEAEAAAAAAACDAETGFRDVIAAYKEWTAARDDAEAKAGAVELAAATSKAKGESIDLCVEAVNSASKVAEAAAAWAAWDAYLDRKRELKEERDELTQPTRPVPPARPAGYSPINAARAAERDRLRDAHASADKLVSTFDAEGVTKCPTCGADSKSLAALIDAARTMRPDLRAKLDECERRLAADAAYERLQQAHDRAIPIYDQALLQYNTQAARIERALQALVKPDKPDFEQPSRTLKQANDRVDSVKKELTAARQALAVAEAARTRAVAEANAAVAERKRLRAAVVANGGKAGYEEARSARAAWRKTKTAADELRGQLAAAKKHRASLKKRRKELKQAEAEQKPLREWRALLEATRKIHHANGAPQRMTSAGLRLVASRANMQLAAGGHPFTIRVLDDLSIRATFADVRGEVDAQQLSGAQLMGLALAIRSGVNAQFASPGGFLVLDEPTTFMDEKRIMLMAPVLREFRSKAKDTGLQCIVVTHAHQLASAFDRTVALETIE